MTNTQTHKPRNRERQGKECVYRKFKRCLKIIMKKRNPRGEEKEKKRKE